MPDPITQSQLDSTWEDLLALRRKYLEQQGWKHTCNTPGSVWLWERQMDGRMLLVDMSTAIDMAAYLAPPIPDRLEPASVKPEWTMPEAPECCESPMKPMAVLDGGEWFLQWVCDECEREGIEMECGWPFIQPVVFAPDWRALGFRTVMA